MKPATSPATIFVAIFAIPMATLAQSDARTRAYSFDQDAAGKPPAGFSFARTKNLGKPGKWVVEAQKDAPSGGKALAQVDKDPTDGRFPVAVTSEAAPADVRVSVKCRAVSGEVDQACGLVFRYRDENNYYVTRANSIEGNVRLYHVKDGKRRQFATWAGDVPGKVWYELAAEAKGDTFNIFFNGKKVIEAKDRTFPEGGKVGLWTKADSVTHFDDLTVSPL